MSSYAVENGNNNFLPHEYRHPYLLPIYQKCIKIGELSGVAYSVTREMTPIYNTEEIIKKHKENIARGRSGIAGSVIFKSLNKEDIINNIFHIQIISDCNTMCIIDAELINEGDLIQLRDVKLEETQYTFVARDIIPWFNQE